MWILERMKDIWKWLNADEGKKALKWVIIGGVTVILYGYFFG